MSLTNISTFKTQTTAFYHMTSVGKNSKGKNT